MLQDPAFWVALAFIGFFAILVYFKLPSLIGKQLDERADRIKTELDEAEKLREDAQALFAEYQRRQREAMATAEEIVAKAREDAEIIRKDSEAELQVTLARRGQLAEAKIAQAEEKALAEVQNIAVEVAIAAAAKLMSDKLNDDQSDALVDQSIKGLQTHLN